MVADMRENVTHPSDEAQLFLGLLPAPLTRHKPQRQPYETARAWRMFCTAEYVHVVVLHGRMLGVHGVADLDWLQIAMCAARLVDVVKCVRHPTKD